MSEVRKTSSASKEARRADAGWAFRFWEKTGMLAVLLAFVAVASVSIDHFFSGQNALGILLSVTTTAFIACTMMLCLASGDFDLSVGSTLALGGMVCVLTSNALAQGAMHGHPLLAVLLGLAAGLAAGACVGFVNGVLISKANVNALIATLITMQVARGVAYLLNNGASEPSKVSELTELGDASFPQVGDFGGISISIWMMMAFFAVFGVLLNLTRFGRNTLAIGGNKEAARLAGIAVDRIKIGIFTMQGMAAAFAGIVLAARLKNGHPGSGQGQELQVIAACVLGGVSLTGGVASMSGVVVGLLIMGTLQNAMNLMNVSTFWQYIVNGGILLASVLLDGLKQRLRR